MDHPDPQSRRSPPWGRGTGVAGAAPPFQPYAAMDDRTALHPNESEAAEPRWIEVDWIDLRKGEPEAGPTAQLLPPLPVNEAPRDLLPFEEGARWKFRRLPPRPPRPFRRPAARDGSPRTIRQRPQPAAAVRRRYAMADLAAFAKLASPVLFAAVVLGAAAGGAVLTFLPRDRLATAVMLVPAADDAAAQTDLAIAHSDEVIRTVVDRLGADRLLRGLTGIAPFDALRPPCPSADRPRPQSCARDAVAARYAVALDAAAAPAPRRPYEAAAGNSGRIMRLAARHPDGIVARDMLAAAIDADRAIRDEATFTRRAAALEPQLAAAEHDLAETLAQQAAVRARSNVLDIDQDMAAASAAAAALAQRQRDLRDRQAAADAPPGRASELAPHKSARHSADGTVRAAGAPTAAPDSAAAAAGASEDDLRAALLQLRLERARMTVLYAPDYPGLAELDQKIQTAEAALRDGRAHQAETLARQSQELAQQAGPIAARVAELRDAAARLAVLEQRRAAQAALVDRLSLAMADLRTEDAVAAADLTQLRVIQQPAVAAPGWFDGAAWPAAGALCGLICGIAAAAILGFRRPTYVVAREAERDLGMPELAQVVLGREGGASGVQALAERLLAAASQPPHGLPAGQPGTIHLLGTTADDGAAQLARPLAEALAAATGMPALLVLHGAGSADRIHSVAPPVAGRGADKLARAVTPRAETSPSHALPPATVARLLLGGRDGADAAEPLRIARLRATHGVVLVASGQHAEMPATRDLAALADISLLVVRARHSRAAALRRLRDDLAETGGRALGFVFTSSRPLPAAASWRSA